MTAGGADVSKRVTNWEHLVDVAKRATRAPEQYGIGLGVGTGGNYMYTFMPYVWMNGGDLLSPDGKRASVDAPEFQQALELWADLAQKHRATPDEARAATPYDATKMFQAGKVAMFHTGIGAMNTFKKDSPNIDYGVQPMPRSPRTGKTSAFMGGELVRIGATTKYKSQGWDVLQWIMSDDVQVEIILAKLYNLPLRDDQYQNRYVRDEPRLAALSEAVKEARAPYHPKYDPLFQRIDSPLAVGCNAAMAGQKAPRQALLEMKQAMDAMLQS